MDRNRQSFWLKMKAEYPIDRFHKLLVLILFSGNSSFYIRVTRGKIQTTVTVHLPYIKHTVAFYHTQGRCYVVVVDVVVVGYVLLLWAMCCCCWLGVVFVVGYALLLLLSKCIFLLLFSLIFSFLLYRFARCNATHRKHRKPLISQPEPRNWNEN